MRYEYTIDGQRYSSERIAYPDISCRTAADAERVIARFPLPGAAANWHYRLRSSRRSLAYSLRIFSFPEETAYRCRVFHYPDRSPNGADDEAELWTFAAGRFTTAQAALDHETAFAARHLADEAD